MQFALKANGFTGMIKDLVGKTSASFLVLSQRPLGFLPHLDSVLFDTNYVFFSSVILHCRWMQSTLQHNITFNKHFSLSAEVVSRAAKLYLGVVCAEYLTDAHCL